MRTFIFRTGLVLAFAALIVALYWRTGAQRVDAVGPSDPNILWRIGVTDNSGDEFSLGSATSVVYDVSAKTSHREWREQQQPGATYKIRFQLDRVPQSVPVLAIHGFAMGLAPQGVILDVNGKRGFFRLPFQGAPDLDQRQANTVLHASTALRIPVDPALLRAGANEMALSLEGESGRLYYDSLALERSGGATEDLAASVEPTIFYRRAGEQLKEVTQIVLRHRQPLKDVSVSLKVGEAVVSRSADGGSYDFGERVIDVEVPAPSAPRPYALTVASSGARQVFRGEFRPEKRWKLFAGLKIHNDIGYTDLPQNVEELDTRNVDNLLTILRRFPTYKFNLEDSWLVENYARSREPARVKQLMGYAASGRVGVSAMYLNLATGLCSGEELYRALYFAKSLQRKHGVPMQFACTTDTPSQPWSVPSVLADAGIAGFTLGSNQHRGMLLQHSNLNEDSPFYWEGPDGRRVMAWFARSYQQLNHLVADRSVEQMRRTIPLFLARYRREKYPIDALYVYGLYTDNADIRTGEAATIDTWNRAYAYPKIVPATDFDYYSYIKKNFGDKLPVFRGDGGSYWHDAAGTSAAATTLNHDTQRLLPLTETLAAWANLFDPEISYPAAELRDAWKDLLFYDEHTWGAHNSISQPDRRFVTDQFDFKQSHAIRAHWAATNLKTRAMSRLVQFISVDGPTMFVFNPGLETRSDIVEVEFEPNRELVDLANGRPVPFDVVMEKDGWRRVRFMAAQVPGMGYKAYGVRRHSAPLPSSDAPQPDSWQIESNYYRIALDPRTGAVAQLYDKELNRDLVDKDAPFRLNELVYSAGGEQQRIIRDMAGYAPTRLDVTGQSGARLVENVRTPFGQRIRIEASAKNVPLIESEITVYNDLKRIDIQNHIRKEDIRAKEAIYFAFPFRVSPPELLYQVHNAWVRPNQDQLPGACRDWFTTPNLVVSRDSGATIAFATPDLPLVTLTDINRGLWLNHLDIRNGHVYSYVTNNYWSTNIKASQGGDIRFRFSITSRKDLDLEALGRFDSDTRTGLAGYPYYDWGNARGNAGKKRMPAEQGRLFEIGAANVQVTVFKKAEDGAGYVLRLRETAGRDGTASLRSPMFAIAQAFLTDGVEANQAPLAVKSGGIKIPLKRNRFSTVRLVFAGAASAQPAAKK